MINSTPLSQFWMSFNQKDFENANKQFNLLDERSQQALLSTLFQKSQHQQKPILVSVLRRVLDEGKSFQDFYESWLPDKTMCNKVEKDGQVFQQHFPIPVRVINAVNINNPREVISIGINWVTNKEEELGFWNYINKATQGNDANNEARQKQIKGVAQGELLGLFKVEEDDNLGVPF
ncbi:TPA: hypothetical protein JBF68_14795 [Legionella pneumophila]|nr:hypothetical protein [Legionella pneumophila]HAU0358583.1 hypothetical protein [Legionella pneumophila]HAU0567131.1 hypothetical protein [Legionella pneumophila]